MFRYTVCTTAGMCLVYWKKWNELHLPGILDSRWHVFARWALFLFGKWEKSWCFFKSSGWSCWWWRLSAMIYFEQLLQLYKQPITCQITQIDTIYSVLWMSTAVSLGLGNNSFCQHFILKTKDQTETAVIYSGTGGHYQQQLGQHYFELLI